MELWDLYDKHRNPTGETMVRGNPVPPDRYHLVVHICIFNSKGQMLIQHRTDFKPTWSGMWDLSVGGSVTAGENSPVGAHREVLEEIGLHIDFSDISPAISVTFSDGFDDYYIIQKDLDMDDLRYQPEEVQGAKWASMEEIFSMIDAGSFIPYHKSFIEYLFFRQIGSGTRTIGRQNA